MASHKVVYISGDGIGPEVMNATRNIVDASGVSIEWIGAQAGKNVVDSGEEDALPQETLSLIRDYHVALKGPTTTPKGSGHQSVNVRMRQELNLFAAVRPARSIPGVKTRYENVDLTIIRENTEGLYAGKEEMIGSDYAKALKIATRSACMKIAQFAFEYARVHGHPEKRRKVTLFHKANILKKTDGMMLECAQAVAKEYDDVDFNDILIDAGCMMLVQDPSQFDILLMENLYGDIVSDLCAGLIGGLGVVGGANFGEGIAVFEAVHGSAPGIAGQGKADPFALIMSASMMLDHLGEKKAAHRIRHASNLAINHGVRTKDIGGTATTSEFAKEVAKLIWMP